MEYLASMMKFLTPLLIIACIFVAGCQEKPKPQKKKVDAGTINKRENKKAPAPETDSPQLEEGPRGPADGDVIDRHPEKLIYSKHARCRMACRHIDEDEVKEILEKGRINHRKSEPAGRPDPKYALEGVTRDGQEVRIVFAAAKRGMVVVTVIDLDTDWSCDCK